MDNDNKVIIQKPEVRLFLQDDVRAMMKEKPAEYNLEEEYKKTKKNKSYYVVWLMIACFAVVGLITFGVTKWITWSNKQITVGIDVFDDLNLKNLLNMVTRTENSLKTLSAEKAKLEIERDAALKQAEIKRDTDLHTLKAMRISRSELKRRTAIINTTYEKQVAEISEKYNPRLAELDVQLGEFRGQLNELNNNELQRAKEQQAAIDSERQVFELEKQQIVSGYEKTVADLRNQITSLQQNSYADQAKRIDELSDKYNARIRELDPNYDDDLTGKSIVDLYAFADDATYEGSNYTAENTPTDLLPVIESANEEFNQIDYLTQKMLSVPHENSLPSYIKTLKQLALKIGNDLTSAAGIFIGKQQQEITELQKNNQSLSSDKAELQRQLKQKIEQLNNKEAKQKKIEEEVEVFRSMLPYFDSLCAQTGDTGFVLNTQNPEKILVYIAPMYMPSVDGTKAYVFRTSNEVIGTVVLKAEGDFVFANPETPEIAAAIKPNDKILLQITEE